MESVAKNFDWKKYLVECLKSTDFCTISTVDSKGVWSNPVYFAWDKEFNFYFISQMSSRHMGNIQNNPRVAMAIYSTAQKGDVRGIQLEGMAKILTESAAEEEVKQAYDTYYGRAGVGPDMQSYLNNPTWLYVKITPEQIYYFDTRFFEEERQSVPMERLI